MNSSGGNHEEEVDIASMICKCGASVRISHSQASDSHQSFAVVRDADFMQFIEIEHRVLTATTDEDQLAGIAEASEYVGSLFICANCDRLVFILSIKDMERGQGKDHVRFFRRE
jgi:hypothetical protein